jgi:hypothetical protein
MQVRFGDDVWGALDDDRHLFAPAFDGLVTDYAADADVAIGDGEIIVGQ